MIDSPEYPDEVDAKAELKELAREISTFAENASEELKLTLLGLLQDWRILGVLENWRHGERRKAPRKESSIAVMYATRGRIFKDFIKNISKLGAFIETPAGFAAGEQITLIISSPDREEPIKIQGEVIWSVPEGVGVRFSTGSRALEELIETL